MHYQNISRSIGACVKGAFKLLSVGVPNLSYVDTLCSRTRVPTFRGGRRPTSPAHLLHDPRQPYAQALCGSVMRHITRYGRGSGSSRAPLVMPASEITTAQQATREMLGGFACSPQTPQMAIKVLWGMRQPRSWHQPISFATMQKLAATALREGRRQLQPQVLLLRDPQGCPETDTLDYKAAPLRR